MLDVIAQLAESLGEKFRQEPIVGKVLPLLNKKWVAIDDNSNTLFPLFECFEAIVTALGISVLDYAEVIYSRSCNILRNYVSTIKVYSILNQTNFRLTQIYCIPRVIL